MLNRKMYRSTQIKIRSKNHKIGVYRQVKTSLCPLEKRDIYIYILGDGINTLAYRINDIENAEGLVQNWE